MMLKQDLDSARLESNIIFTLISNKYKRERKIHQPTEANPLWLFILSSHVNACAWLSRNVPTSAE